MEQQNVLIAKNIVKTFGGVQALKDVSFELKPGQIHCLVGENGSGKSTFVKAIAGEHAPDSGTIIINGNVYSRLTVAEAIKEGIQVIYQDFSLFDHMTVAENIAINKTLAENKSFINWKEIFRFAGEQLEKIGIELDLKQTVEDLSIANKQLVAICRALSLDARIIFMDEPTTALTKSEVDRLMSIVLNLKKQGVSVVFISHKLDEIMKVADDIAVFKDGQKVADFQNSDEITEQMLTYYMTGRKVAYQRYEKVQEETETVLEVQNLTKEGHYKNIDFSVEKGDILGLIGLLGSGRTQIALSLFGLNPIDNGTIRIEGKECEIKTPMNAVEFGISLVPENRRTQGCYMMRSIGDNVCSTILPQFRKSLRVLDRKAMKERALNTIKDFRIVTPDELMKVTNLSGGNQQKVVLGRWIASHPKVLILDSPTVGVDVGSKAEIYEKIHFYAAQGVGVILISDEIPEILANCNKLLVMRQGEIIARMGNEELSNAAEAFEKIVSLING